MRGFPPYYLDIPTQKRIVFATGKWGPSDPGVIHVVDFGSKQHVEFRMTWGEGSGFGDGIGRTIKGEQDSVVSATETEIILANETLGSRTKRNIVLDLKEGKIRSVEWFVYDGKGTLTNRYVKEF